MTTSRRSFFQTLTGAARAAPAAVRAKLTSDPPEKATPFLDEVTAEPGFSRQAQSTTAARDLLEQSGLLLGNIHVIIFDVLGGQVGQVWEETRL